MEDKLKVPLEKTKKGLKKTTAKLDKLRQKLDRRLGKSADPLLSLRQTLENEKAPKESKRLTKKDAAQVSRLVELAKLVSKHAERASREAAKAQTMAKDAREDLRSIEDGVCKQLRELEGKLREARKLLARRGTTTTGIFNYSKDPLYDRLPGQPWQSPFC